MIFRHLFHSLFHVDDIFIACLLIRNISAFTDIKHTPPSSPAHEDTAELEHLWLWRSPCDTSPPSQQSSSWRPWAAPPRVCCSLQVDWGSHCQQPGTEHELELTETSQPGVEWSCCTWSCSSLHPSHKLGISVVWYSARCERWSLQMFQQGMTSVDPPELICSVEPSRNWENFQIKCLQNLYIYPVTVKSIA